MDDFDLDIELLHKQTELFDSGFLVHRGSGKTTVVIYKILGFLETAQSGSTLVVVAHDPVWCKMLFDKISQKIKQYKIDTAVLRQNEILTETGVHVIFITPKDILSHGLLGINITNYLIDDYDTFLQKHLDQADMIIDYLNSLIKGD